MLYNFPNENFYKSVLNENVTKTSYEFIETIMDQFKHRTWDCDIRTSYSLTNNILNYPELHSLKMNVIGHVNNFMQLRNNLFNGYIDNSWVNVYEKKFYQEVHSHVSPVKKFISGVLYLTHDNSSLRMMPHMNGASSVTIQPEYGDIILFDDTVPHSVKPNEKENLRVSLAFNFTLSEKA
tara:strand:- start:620 stop:1159 length:540 start_codon:yes stop_codon:yes gene_type:complete